MKYKIDFFTFISYCNLEKLAFIKYLNFCLGEVGLGLNCVQIEKKNPSKD